MTTLEATTHTLSFEGRFGFGIDKWAYVPFDVPAGIERIDVSTSHDRFSVIGVARNVLDLGIFGPAGHELGNAEGFRGWSGGARTGFTLSATDATPGYLAGPIDSGRWALAFGPVVLNPLGMDWRATIELHRRTHPLPMQPRVERAAVASRSRGSGWYRGDLHLHTVHSDGQHTIDDLVEAATTAGLDFIVSTDHNTSSANRAWAATASGDLTVIGGEEVTTRHGHWLAVGLSGLSWVDWRYAPRDDVFGSYASQVRADGGMVVAAHPSVPLPGSAWEFGYHGVDALEVWNGLWNVDDELSLRIWHQQLRSGRRIVAVGGSDSHGPHQPVGRPQTVVYTDDLSPQELIGAMRRGRCYVAESSAVELALSASLDDGTAVAGPGETLHIPRSATVTVTASVRGAPDASIAIITEGGCVRRGKTDDRGEGTMRWTASSDARFSRVEVRHASRARMRSMIALTNPVWLSSTA